MKHLAAVVLSLVAACGSKSPAPQTPTPAEGGPAGASKLVSGGTLQDLQSGDVSCSVIATNEGGEEMTLSAGYEVCPGGERDASGLIGQRVVWTWTRANVLAAECEGDVDCGKSEEIDLIDTITAAE